TRKDPLLAPPAKTGAGAASAARGGLSRTMLPLKRGSCPEGTEGVEGRSRRDCDPLRRSAPPPPPSGSRLGPLASRATPKGGGWGRISSAEAAGDVVAGAAGGGAGEDLVGGAELDQLAQVHEAGVVADSRRL